MKPIIKVTLSILIPIIITLAIIGAYITHAIAQSKVKYSAEELAMVSKTLSFPEGIEELKASTGVNITYHVKDTAGFKVILTATKAGIEYLKAENKDGILKIYFDKKHPNRAILKENHITITGPAIPCLDMSSGSNLTARGAYRGLTSVDANSGANVTADSILASNIDIDLSSGAYAQLKAYDCDSIKGEASSGATLKISGNHTRYIDLDVSSGASINATGIRAQTGKIEASSGGDIEGNITQLTKTSISSGGTFKNIE